MRTNTFEAICLAMILSLSFGASCFADTYVLCNYMTTYLDGLDQYGVIVHDAGGGLRYIRVKVYEYPTFAGDPNSQSFSSVSYVYYPDTTSLVVGLDDQFGNAYREIWWGHAAGPCTLDAGWYRTLEYFSAYVDATLDGTG
jgi:hypothetical protein